MSITERDRIFEYRGKNIKVPLDWMYVNPSRLKKNKALLKVILNNQREGAPFIINEQRYRLVNDEIVEVIFENSVNFAFGYRN